MFDALCTYDNQRHLYSVISFEQLTDDQIERYRQHLECPECGARAYYRKASSHGRSACFGSRYHSEGCTQERTTAASSREQADAREVAALLDNKVVTFSFDAARSSVAQKGQARPGPVRERQPAKPGQPRPLTLEKALNSLMHGSDLAQSDALIELDKGYRFKARNLFVNFADADAADSAKEARPKMFWGTVSHSDGEIQWLNPAECTDVGIPIRRHRSAILDRFDIEEAEQLEGAGIILFGKCYWNRAKTRKIIELWNAERIYLSKASD